jgi:hypothetical protein
MKWVAMPIAQGIVSAGDQALAICADLENGMARLACYA